MKRNLILNSIVLFVTSFLLVLVVLAWYVSNSTVRATGIIVKTSDEDYTLVLQKGSFDYDKTKKDDDGMGWKWNWEDADALTFSNIQPGDAFFFRIVMNVDSDEAHSFDVSFASITSELIDGMLEAYYNSSLVEYEAVPATAEFDNTKDYYIGTFTKETLTIGDPIKKYLYYEKNETTYEMTSDDFVLKDSENEEVAKEYYKAKFTKVNITKFSTGITYYVQKSSGLNPAKNALGYKYDKENNKFDYRYTLNNQNKVLIKSKDDKNKDVIKTIYTYDSVNNKISLGDFKIHDVFKVHSIGVHDKEFLYTDMLFDYEIDAVDQNVVKKPLANKKYYYDNGYHANGLVELKDNVWDPNVTYYTLGNRKTAYYPNSKLLNAKYNFNTPAEAGKTYYYFALEFNEEISTEIVDGTPSSNCYLYQKLSIRELKVEKKDN